MLILNNTNAKTKLLINEAFFLERQIHAYPDEAYLACTFPFCRLCSAIAKCRINVCLYQLFIYNIRLTVYMSSVKIEASERRNRETGRRVIDR